MYDEEFRRKAYVLGKEHSIDILRYTYDKNWVKASDVAEYCGLHIATASKYLSELHDIGLLNKRIGQGKTREVKEYSLKGSKIEFSFDLSDKSGQGGILRIELEFYKDIFNSLMDRSKGLLGIYPSGLDKIGEIETVDNGVKEDILGSIMKVIKFNEERIGLASTKRLVKRASKKHVEEKKRWVKKYRLLNEFPDDYEEVLEEIF